MKRFLYITICTLLSIGAWAQNVAKIGTTEYETLAKAVAAVPTDGTETTITMLADVDLGTTYITLPATKNIVLELNGKTISGATSSTNATINVTGKLTIKGEGTISSSTRYVIKQTQASSLVILNGGTLETTAANYAAVYVSKGSFIMNGGNVNASTNAIEGNTTINGGTITSTNGYAVYASSSTTTAIIEGGTLTGAAAKGAVGIYTGNVKVAEGATLNSKIIFTSSATGLILYGTAASHIDNATANLAVYDGETLLGYATANTSGTIASGKSVKVINDITTSSYLSLGATKFDLNGHNITSTGAAAIAISGTSASNPRTTTITGEGNVSCNNGSGCNAIQIGRYAKVTIEGGNYSVGGDTDNTTIYIVDGVSANPTVVNITGGTFKSGDGRYVLNIKDDKRAYASFNVTGGTFVGFDPADNIAEGEHTNFVAPDYKSVDNGDGTYSVVEREYVAQIGEKKYESLTEAIEAAQNDEIVTLLANVTDNIVIPAGKEITLELNGKTLSGGTVESNGGSKNKKPAILNYGTITIKDSSAEQTGTIKREDNDTSLSASNSYYVIDNQGTMTIKSGNIMNKAGVPGAHNGSSLIRNGEVAAGAVLNIEGGTLTQDNFDVIKNGGNNSVLNITGGTINSANSYAILSYDEVNMTAGEITGNVCLRSYDTDFAVGNITGGTIKGNITVETYPGNTPDKLSECNISGTAVIKGHLSIGEGNGSTFTPNDEKGTIAVSGGTFSEEVPEQYCAPGYSPVTTPNSEGMYEVETTKVASVGDNRYTSLQEAVDAATDGATIKLIRDGLKYELVEPNKTITLDLNGFTYDCNIDNYGTLTITDSSAEGMGKIVNTKKHWIVWNNPAATLTIQNGTIAFETRENAKSDTGQQAIVNEGSLTINGGVIDGYTADYNTGIADSYTDTYAVENIKGDVTINGGKLMGLHSLSTFGGTSAVINDGQFIVPFGPGTNAVYNYTDDLTVYIKGGTFIGDTDYLINKNDNSDGSFCITGGKFYKYDPQHSKSENPIANFVPKEYAAQEDADGYFVIVPAIAYIDEMGYAVLDTAIEEAKEAESATTITLLANAETTKETLPDNVTINANNKVLTMPTFIVYDGEAIAYPNVTGADTYKVRKATYIRTNISSTEWGTVCLPFSLTSDNGADYYTYNNISGSTLTVDKATAAVEPNTPVVFKKAKGGDLNINETDATVSLNATPADGGALIGTYTDANITADGTIYFINGDTFHKAQVSLKVPMYRAYIQYPSTESKLYINVSGEENVDAIGTLTMDNAEVEAVYDAAGRRIQTPQQGLNIMRLANGKTVKVMVK